MKTKEEFEKELTNERIYSTTKIRESIINFFYENNNTSFKMSEIANEIGMSHATILPLVRLLHNEGILKVKYDGITQYFIINKSEETELAEV